MAQEIERLLSPLHGNGREVQHLPLLQQQTKQISSPLSMTGRLTMRRLLKISKIAQISPMEIWAGFFKITRLAKNNLT